jgi:hypothetical protein
MAKWAFWMFVAALASVLLTSAGVFLIWRTLHHTRRAADAAGKAVTEAENATAAANRTTDETRRIGEAQVRAYLSITDATVEILNRNNAPQIKVRLRNSGQSPAKNVQIFVKAALIIRPDYVRVITKPKVEEREPGLGSDIASNEESKHFTTRSVLDSLNKRELDEWQAGSLLCMETVLNITFEDAFKNVIEDEQWWATAFGRSSSVSTLAKTSYTRFLSDLKPKK